MGDAFFYLYDTTYFDWDNIEKYDNWLYVFDKLPNRMRLIVDLRVGRSQPAEIAKLTKLSVYTVKNQLTKAKLRFLRGAKLI